MPKKGVVKPAASVIPDLEQELPGMKNLQVGKERRTQTADLTEHFQDRAMRVTMVVNKAPSDSKTRERIAQGLGDNKLNMQRVVEAQDRTWQQYRDRYAKVDSDRRRAEETDGSARQHAEWSARETAAEEAREKAAAAEATNPIFSSLDISKFSAFDHVRYASVAAFFALLMMLWVSWN